MKKLFVIVFFLISVPSFAQRFSFGVRGGYGDSWLRPKGTDVHTIFKSSFQAGLFGELKIIRPLYIQVEALYMNIGGASKITIPYTIFGAPSNLSFTAKSDLNYISLPVQVKLKFGKIVKPYLMTGLAPQFLLSAPDITQVIHVDKNKLYTTTDLSLVNTLGLELNLKIISIFIDLRMQNGLTNISKFSSSTIRTNSLTLNTGVKF